MNKKLQQNNNDEKWSLVIYPVSGWLDINLKDLWNYRDLILLFVRRDFVSVYKQTVLGPLWYLIQPILTTLVFTLIFNKVAKLPTDGLHPVLFYLSGVIVWRYFADCLQKTANTFGGNARIFGKVYFPRLSVPLSVVISNLISFAIQFSLFLSVLTYFYFKGLNVDLGLSLLVLPLLVLQMASLGLGCGIIISSLTTKYRDFAQLVSFGVQLWMFATPVVYPASIVSKDWSWLLAINPMSSVLETFRYIFLGVGTINTSMIVASMFFTVLILLLGVVLFSRVEKSFMDVV